MNNKGFAITGILYTILIMFLVFISMMLFNLQNRKTILDELKVDAVNAVESDNNYEYLLNEINSLKSQIGTSDISSIGGTITGAVSSVQKELSSIIKVIELAKSDSFTVQKGWMQVPVSIPDGYTVVAVTSYFNQPGYIQSGGDYFAGNYVYIAYDCYLAGNYTASLKIAIVKTEYLSK